MILLLGILKLIFIKLNLLISVPIIWAKTMLTIITVAIVTIDVTALVKPNNTMAPAIGVAIPLTPITGPLNVTIHALTTPISAFCCHMVVLDIALLNQFASMAQYKLQIAFDGPPMFNFRNKIRLTNELPVHVSAPTAIGDTCQS